MKRTSLYFTLLVGMILSLSACQPDPVLYQFTDGKAEVSFPAATAIFQMVPEDGNKIAVVLQRGNTAGNVDIPVSINNKTQGVFQAAESVFHFKDGESRATLEFTYPDLQKFGGETYVIGIKVNNAAQVSPSGIDSCTVKASRKLTMKSLGTGTYYSDFYGEEWDQEILKAEEADYYELPDCWVSGTSFAFTIVNGEVEWLTQNTGYYYSSYGQYVYLGYYTDTVVEFDGKVLTLYTSYDLPGVGSFGDGFVEQFTFPE